MLNNRFEPKEITGTVESVDIKGYGPNSAELVFVIKPRTAEKIALVARTLPLHEPQIFTSMAQLVTSAYFQKCEITAWFHPQDHDTAHVFEVKIPANEIRPGN